jgi:hypothetical protein
MLLELETVPDNNEFSRIEVDLIPPMDRVLLMVDVVLTVLSTLLLLKSLVNMLLLENTTELFGCCVLLIKDEVFIVEKL